MKRKDTLKVGDRIEIISFPRKSDGADAYAGLTGVVEEFDDKTKYINGKGHIALKLPSGGRFFGTGVKRLKYKKV